MRRIVGLVLMLVLAGCQARATEDVVVPQTATLEVRVVDIELAPFRGANVTIDNSSAYVTDELGRVLVPGISPGPHDVAVTSPGFDAVQSSVTLAPNETRRLDFTLHATPDPFELNYYLGIICPGNAPGDSCDRTAATFEPTSRGAGVPGGMRNASLLVQWEGGDEYSFDFEVRRNGSALPFSDHELNLTFAGASPLKLEIPESSLSDPMRLGGIGFRLVATKSPQAPVPTNITAVLGVYSEVGANATFPPLTETARHMIAFDGAPGPALLPNEASQLIVLEMQLFLECPTGVRQSATITLSDSVAAGFSIAIPDQDYVCGLRIQPTPGMVTASFTWTRYLWNDAQWTLDVAGDCTCELEVRMLEGMLPLPEAAPT